MMKGVKMMKELMIAKKDWKHSAEFKFKKNERCPLRFRSSFELVARSKSIFLAVSYCASKAKRKVRIPVIHRFAMWNLEFVGRVNDTVSLFSLQIPF
jgi:hypothetical protein